jgi:NADPH-dependent 7-cyano-7-deazaguanine reductase QueF
MDAIARRDHLGTAANPNTRTDYLVSLSGEIAGLCRVEIRYIPDQAILTPASFAAYLKGLAAHSWTHLEEIAASIVSDLNNELVPRWVQVSASGSSADMAHRVTVEDRQPRWDNPVLLSRIGSA